MAKATDTITLTAVRDIESVTWYYQLKAGTSAPAKPTASPPPSPCAYLPQPRNGRRFP